MIREIKSMNYVNDSDFGNIMSIVYKHRDWLGHIRTDYIRQTIINNAKAFNFDTNFASKSPTTNLLIFENDVIISYNIYKRKQKLNKPYYNKETNKVIEAQPGDCILHQIVAKDRNGSAKTVFNKFLRYCSGSGKFSARRFMIIRHEETRWRSKNQSNGKVENRL